MGSVRLVVEEVLLVLAFCAAAVGIELLGGASLYPAHPPGVSHSLQDAAWHVGTAFVLSLPARDRRLWAVVPVLALAFDVDHVFGAFLPTVLLRQAHDVFFVALAGAALYRLDGRTAAFAAVGAMVAHMGVDGGGFPFFAPVSLTAYPLPVPLAITFVAVGELFVFLSVRSPLDLRRPFDLVALLAAGAAVALTLVFVPWLNVFNGN